jgi:diguanylate cyclase (GGDEF)-like protein
MATILVVDTEPAERRVYTTLLGNFGHRLLEASDGAEALEVTRTELPDLIITNIVMPHMDGFTFVRRLRAEPLLAGIPVIFQTATFRESEISQLAQKSGVRHILIKPTGPQEILRTVNSALKQPATHPRLPQTGQLQRKHLELVADKLYQKVAELERTNDQLRNLSLTDELTGLNNRRGFMILATALLKFARRGGHSLCLLYIDLDSLKSINNTFGHAAGDMAITHFARILNETFRDSDVIGRLGGDEFVVLTIDSSENVVADIESRLQNNVNTFNFQSGEEYALSFSIGGIQVDLGSMTTMEELLTQADKAMYKHKHSRKQAAN